MDRQEKMEWMAIWAAKNGAALNLEGECGFGRECVGIIVGGSYPDYHWYDYDTYDQLDKNGEVWIPEDAYHKAEVVAVLGRGEEAEAQLFEWLKWFDNEGFKVEKGRTGSKRPLDVIQLMLGRDRFQRMVKPEDKK